MSRNYPGDEISCHRKYAIIEMVTEHEKHSIRRRQRTGERCRRTQRDRGSASTGMKLGLSERNLKSEDHLQWTTTDSSVDPLFYAFCSFLVEL